MEVFEQMQPGQFKLLISLSSHSKPIFVVSTLYVSTSALYICHDTCKVTPDVTNPCGSAGDNPASLRALSTIIATFLAATAVAMTY